MGFRLPMFDIEITAQKQSPYSKMSQNELALQFYNAGFFNPQMAPQALACLDMMDFDRKNFVMQKIAQNGALMQAIAAMGASGGEVKEKGATTAGRVDETEALGGSEKGEASNTKKARQRVAESTDPT